MPWFKIPEESLAHLGLFNYDKVQDLGDAAWYRGPYGRLYVEKSNAWILLEDINDAIQLKAEAVITPGRRENPN